MVYFRQVRNGTFQLRPLWTFVECLATASPRLKRWDWTFPLSRLLPLFIWTIAYQLCKTVALTTFVHTHTHVFGVLLNIYLCVYVCVQEVWMSVHSSGAIHLVFMDRSLTRTWGSPLSLGWLAGELRSHHAWLFTWALEVEPGPSRLCSKNCTNWTLSQLHKEYLFYNQ